MAKKKDGVNFIVHYQLYPFDVMVSIGESDEKLFDTLKRRLPESDFADIGELELLEPAKGRCVMFGGGATVIRLNKMPTTPEDRGVLAHEIFHAVELLFVRIRIKHHFDCGEAYAYAIQYLTTEIYNRAK